MSHWKILPDTNDQFYFLSCVVTERAFLFTSHNYFQTIIQSLKYCQEKKDLRLAGYVIMPNHVHLICAGSSAHPLSDTIRDFKQFTAKKIIEELQAEKRALQLALFRDAAERDGRGSNFKIWMEGNHPILVNSDVMFREKLLYMHNNPVRKGYVEKPEHWLYSSARNYVLGDHGMIRVECLV
jgi:REP element-mobilizing transposase RayT